MHLIYVYLSDHIERETTDRSIVSLIRVQIEKKNKRPTLRSLPVQAIRDFFLIACTPLLVYFIIWCYREPTINGLSRVIADMILGYNINMKYNENFIRNDDL